MVGEALRLFDQIVVFPAPEGSADERDGAIGAPVGTPFGDFQIGQVRRCEKQAWKARIHEKRRRTGNKSRSGRAGPLQVFNMPDNVRHFGRSEKEIHFGDFPLQLLAVALGQTARYDQAGARAMLFPCGQAKDFLDGFLLGRGDKGTGVHNDDIGIIGPCRQRDPSLGKEPAHNFGVDEIFRTAKADKMQATGFLHGDDSIIWRGACQWME
ncbi:MAG: hypothetical protein CSYNP_04392 [Syntrophus sp. SKADARSKE-3]|nr:hypothetical protein [Syntrophus sp. SKADARSKE-3]